MVGRALSVYEFVYIVGESRIIFNYMLLLSSLGESPNFD